MRQGRVLLWWLLAVLLGGCAHGLPARSTSWFDRLKSLPVPTGPDVIHIDVVLLERPINDSYINQEVWMAADEQAIPLERKAVLEENGFRIGQIGGATPAELQSLLTSERSCVNPRHLFLRAGTAKVLGLGPELSQCRFQIARAGENSLVALDQAACNLRMLPTLTEKGQLRIQFTPEVEYGNQELAAQPAEDGSGLTLRPRQPTQSFPALSWEVLLAPNQYLIVGTYPDRPESLGYQCFLRRDEAAPVQRLLVMRAWRSGAAADIESTFWPDDDVKQNASTPLALQATWTKARGRMGP
jgi:hypothetical protein